MDYSRMILFSEIMSRTTFLNVDDTKAGMEDLDKEKINKLIQDASKSRKEENELKRNLNDLIRFKIF
jgi:hypothetical protein